MNNLWKNYPLNAIYMIFGEPDVMDEVKDKVDKELSESQQLLEDVDGIIASLRYEQRELVWGYLKAKRPLEETAEKLGLSLDQAEQFHAMAWCKLRHPKRSRPLAKYAKKYREEQLKVSPT